MLPSQPGGSVSKQSVPAALTGRRWCSGGSRGYLARTLRQGILIRGSSEGTPPTAPGRPQGAPQPQDSAFLIFQGKSPLFPLFGEGPCPDLGLGAVLKGQQALSRCQMQWYPLTLAAPAPVPTDNSRRHTSERACLHTHMHTHTARGVWQMRLASGSLRIRCRWLIVHARRQLWAQSLMSLSPLGANNG